MVKEINKPSENSHSLKLFVIKSSSSLINKNIKGRNQAGSQIIQDALNMNAHLLKHALNLKNK